MTSPLTFLKAAFQAYAEARQAEAARYVTGVLLAYDDETLRKHGYVPAELRRRSGRSPF